MTAGLLGTAVGALFALGVVLPSSLIVFAVLLGVWVACIKEWTAIACPPLKGVGMALISLGIISFCVVYHHAGWQGCVYVVGIAALTDTLAYITGSIVGGPKLCPSISPGKTWSGAIIGFVLSATVGTLVVEYVWAPLSWSAALVISALLCSAAQGGDLLESAGKRRCQVKDTGTLLPGHGGVLDRVDSWLMAGVMVALLLSLFPATASASPYDEWINRTGHISRHKRKDLGFLLEKTGFHVGQPSTQKTDLEQCAIASWHVDDIMKAAQGKINTEFTWFLPGERWGMANKRIASRTQALDIIKKCNGLLHLKRGMTVKNPGPDFLLLGSTAQEVDERMNFVNKFLEKIDPKNEKNLNVYVLTGPRPLLDHEKGFLKNKLEKVYGKRGKDSIETEMKKINSEEEMIAFMLKNGLGSGFTPVPHYAGSQYPHLSEKNATTRHKSHLIIGEKDVNRGRATTATTVEAWIEYMDTYSPLYKSEQKQSPKRFTIVSAAPFIAYQWQVVENIVKPTHPKIEFNVIGPRWRAYQNIEKETDEKLKRYAAVGLDTLSRLIYELHKAWHQHQKN